MRAAVGVGARVGVFAGLACLALSACSSVVAREDAAASAALSFEENLRGGQALLGLELPSAGELRRVDVYRRQARVVLDSDTLFLSSFPDGWKVVAAGCEPQSEPELPYRCDVKGG
ncbi:hypothetical protein J7E96_05490 [Streptomyces sp. ISL-96]|uniref:hypothetical protein n=1 Tax=Streptomyces sp. ISL-96 TaxID=2819191 RepID=UPI001BECDEF9|nr:hypothetical protein [Streptomyces sp. ISL-96]MBT2487995.1 hypothetical protein [Streptomyces sp. ISL-96]